MGLFSDGEEAERLGRIEAKLDLILDHLGVEFPDPRDLKHLDEETRALADAGGKIAAIKRYRETSGAGLRDARLAVTAYLRDRGR